MKCTIPEISWHNRDPVLSVDFQRLKINQNNKDEKFWRLATGGADSHVCIWHVGRNEIGGISTTCVTDLSRHQKAVNVVRFSHCGEILASGDDEAVIILWKRKGSGDIMPLLGEESSNKEQWISWKVLRGHLEDVYDMSWSPNSKMLVSGSVDNTAIVWDINKGRSMNILQDSKGFVQGVAWDPLNQYVATMSTDRQCRLIDLNTMKTVQRANKAKIPTPPGHRLAGKTIRLFHDDTFKSFFRRLTFSNDGLLLIVPSGIIEPQESTDRLLHATMVFARHNIREPIMVLPTLEEPTIAVRCCPINFELRDDGPEPVIALPYRMVFAVATQKSIMIYDTQQLSPVGIVSNIHYTRLTDVTWSSDGRILIVSSTDGFCSIVDFQEGELGREYSADKSTSVSKIDTKDGNKNETDPKQTYLTDFDNEAMDVDTAINLKTQDKRMYNKSPGVPLVENNKNVKNRASGVVDETTEDIKLVYNETSINQPTSMTDIKSSTNIDEALSVGTKTTPPKTKMTPILSVKTPRRVQLITLSSPKRRKKD